MAPYGCPWLSLAANGLRGEDGSTDPVSLLACLCSRVFAGNLATGPRFILPTAKRPRFTIRGDLTPC